MDSSLNPMSILTKFLNKSISLPFLGNTWISAFCADLAEAARTESYIETLGNKADTLHKYISLSDERSLKRAYEYQIRSVIKHLNLKDVELAIDTKKDLFYGKHAGLHARNIKCEHGAEQAWEYVVVSIVRPLRLPLMAVPYYQGADLASLSIELLEYARSLPINITKVLFDRGFHNAHLIDYLESAKTKKPLPYLILVRRDEAIKKYIEQTTAKIGVFQHQFSYSKYKSKWSPKTTIVVCKEAGTNKKGEPYDMVFATNLKPSFNLVKEYKNRWNIETGFRVMEEGKIMTKSNNTLIRLFYFVLRALFTAIWLLQKTFIQYYPFKRYLRVIEHMLRQSEVHKPPSVELCC
jgi:hypothetical protein